MRLQDARRRSVTPESPEIRPPNRIKHMTKALYNTDITQPGNIPDHCIHCCAETRLRSHRK